MKRMIIGIGSLIGLMSLLLACGSQREVTTAAQRPVPGGAEEESGPCPVWFASPPQDPEHLYAAATATSKDLQLAINKATTEGRAEIAAQMEARLKGLRTKFDEEVGLGEDAQLLSQYKQAVKVVISQVLNGSRVAKQSTPREGMIWRACVLMEMPIGAANKAFVDQIRANQALYTRFRASQAFKEMEEEVEQYEQYKKEQGVR